MLNLYRTVQMPLPVGKLWHLTPATLQHSAEGGCNMHMASMLDEASCCMQGHASRF